MLQPITDKLKNSPLLATKLMIIFALSILIIHYGVLIQFSSALHWDTDYKYLYFSAKPLSYEEGWYYGKYFFHTDLNTTTGMINLNPPFVAILMTPFSLLNYPTSFFIWSICSLTLAIISTILIVNVFFHSQKRTILYLGSAALVCAYFPTFANIKCGQIGALLFFLITLGWIFFREQKTPLAGIFLGIAFSIKLFVGLFLILFLIRKEWAILRIFLATALGCILISLLIFNPETYFNYSHVFGKIQWYSASWNASLLGFFSRLFGYQNEQNIALINLPKLTPIFYFFSVILLFFSFVFFRKKQTLSREITSASNDLAISYTIVAMLLISPLGWIYYFSVLFIPFAIIFYWNQRLFHLPWLNFLLAAAIFFSSAPYLLLKPGQITDPQNIFLQSGIYFYALCLLMGLIFHLNWRLSRNIDLIQARQIKTDSLKTDRLLLIALFFAAILPSFLGILHMTYLIAAKA